MASAVASEMTGSEIAESIDDLDRLLERMESYLHQSGNEAEVNMDRLCGIMRLMNGIDGSMEDFRRIAKSLKALVFTAKVQFACLLPKEKELNALFADIEKLSGIMAAKLGSIMKNLRSLEESIRAALRRLDRFKGELQGKVKEVLCQTAEVLCSVTGHYGLSAKKAGDISERSTAISRNTGEIVISVQFHDITRQQFERVGKRLRGLRETGAYIGPVTAVEGENGCDTGVLGTAVACSREATAVNAIRDEFVTAVGTMRANLRNIAVNAVSISEDTRSMVGHGRREAGTFLTETEWLLSSVKASCEAFSENAEARVELSRTLLTVIGAITEASGFISQVEEIGEDVELVAFNTQVRSAHILHGGSAFEVAAEFIRRLSTETLDKARTVSDTLKAISAAVGELSVCADSAPCGTVNNQHAIPVELDKLIGMFSRLNGSIASLSGRIGQEADALSLDIENLAEGLDVHSAIDRSARKISSLLSEAAFFEEAGLPPGSAEGERSCRTAGMSHYAVDDRLDGNASGSVELF